MPTPDNLYRAYIKARDCAEGLLKGYALTTRKDFNAHLQGIWMRDAESEFRKLADLLGYDVTKRLTPAEAHEAALARFREQAEAEHREAMTTVIQHREAAE